MNLYWNNLNRTGWYKEHDKYNKCLNCKDESTDPFGNPECFGDPCKNVCSSLKNKPNSLKNIMNGVKNYDPQI